MKNLKFLLIVFLLPIFSCDNDDNDNLNLPTNNCDDAAIISQDEFMNAPNSPHNINSISIENDCMTISFGASGCDGSSWEMKLIDSESLAFSQPPQKFLRLSLSNQEICAAYFSKTIDFDISGVQINESPILLNFEGYEDLILYEY